MDTLVLDNQGKPVSFMTWQDAVTLIWKDRCVVVDEDPEKILRSPSFEICLPTVIRLKNDFAKKCRRQVPFSRRNVAIRDKSRCQYCGKLLQTHEYTYDHVFPRSRGGGSGWRNVVLSCVSCNFYKADRTPAEAGMFLLNKPVRPDVNDKRFTFRLRVKNMKSSWLPYESWLYWNEQLDEE